MLREWYMHPNGQIPAYEWDFNDVNPPILSLAARAVFDIEHQRTGVADYAFHGARLSEDAAKLHLVGQP